MKNKNYILAGLVIVLIIIVLVMARKSGNQTTAPIPSHSTSSTAPVSNVPPPKGQLGITNIPAGTLPKGMPTNLPFEKNAKIVENVQIKDPTSGKTQSTRTYISSNSVAADYAAYQQYLKTNGWTIVSSLSQTNVANLNASKGSATLDITIAKDASGQVTVSVAFIQ